MDPWPAHLQSAAIEGAVGGSCELPEWIQGKWEHVHVQGGTLVLKDQRNFKTYTARCVGQRRPMHEERFLIYARTECGDEHYKCVWLKNRGDNAMEFQIGEWPRFPFFRVFEKLVTKVCPRAHFGVCSVGKFFFCTHFTRVENGTFNLTALGMQWQ